MNNEDPAYYQNGKFYFLDGRIEETKGSIMVDDTEISKANMWKVASSYALPHSMLASLFSGKKYIDSLYGLSVVFFDVETDDNEQFLFAYASVDGVMHRFASVEALVDFLLRYDVVVGFNSFRFDYEVIFRKDARFHEVDCSGFKIRVVPNKINIDAFFYFCCWKPWKDSHSLNSLAEELGIVRSWDLSDKEEKCKEDVQILAAFWSHLTEVYSFLAWFGMDHLSCSSIPARWFSKLRRWMLQGWALKNGIMPALVRRESTNKADFFRYCRRGFYRDVKSFDVSNAYPSTAARLRKGLWRQGDFADYMQWLMKMRRQAAVAGERDFVKYVSVTTIGDMGSSAGFIFDREMFCDVWNTFREQMESWVRRIGKKNIVYSYTDNVVTSLVDVREMHGYDIRLKGDYAWFCCYNIERVLAMRKDGSVMRNHFNRGMAQLGMWKELEKRIDEKLRKDPEAFLLKPELDVLSQLPDDCFKIVVRKTEEQCRNLDYYMIWDELRMGFNEVYLARNGITLDPKKKSMKKYEKLVKDYLKFYRFTVVKNGKRRNKG